MTEKEKMLQETQERRRHAEQESFDSVHQVYEKALTSLEASNRQYQAVDELFKRWDSRGKDSNEK